MWFCDIWGNHIGELHWLKLVYAADIFKSAKKKWNVVVYETLAKKYTYFDDVKYFMVLLLMASPSPPLFLVFHWSNHAVPGCWTARSGQWHSVCTSKQCKSRVCWHSKSFFFFFLVWYFQSMLLKLASYFKFCRIPVIVGEVLCILQSQIACQWL